jgi:DNA-binding transcriptional ArsR family regulator
MPTHADILLQQLSREPRTARQLAAVLSVSQPTLSRLLATLGDEIVRFGAARSIQYTRRDSSRGLPDIAVYRADADGRLRRLGLLVPVYPEGFVMRQDDGKTLYSDGLPWWLYDMRPQGYLGRAYAARYGAALQLPERLVDWTDTHALRALLAHGGDGVGNLLLGDVAREHFLASPAPTPINADQKNAAYGQLAREAAQGEIPGSSAGGEQPKFTVYAVTADGPQHLIVKFSEREAGPVTERWRDLLLAEHLALTTLREAGVPAAQTWIVDADDQRFLEVERFDRVGPLGRRGVFSLAALDAEFVGAGTGTWPSIAARLAVSGEIRPQALQGTELLWAFGVLIGNTDMHNGNVSFVSEHGRPYELAPAYDMTPMAFAPSRAGGLPDTLNEANLHPSVANETWRRAEELANRFLARLRITPGFSDRFQPCLAALENHLTVARAQIARMG